MFMLLSSQPNVRHLITDWFSNLVANTNLPTESVNFFLFTSGSEKRYPKKAVARVSDPRHQLSFTRFR
jgi:hypothetical protein